jgi:protein ImuB
VETYWLAVRLPFLSLEALNIDVRNDASIVVSSKNKVMAATLTCLEQGVEVAMPASTAAVIMKCDHFVRDSEKEAALFTKICDQLYAFTPYIQVYNPNPKNDYVCRGLLLDLTRCIRLFKGLDPLLQHIKSALHELGLMFVCAVGHSGQAAWLLSFQYELEGARHVQTRDSAGIDLIQTHQLHEFPEEAEALEATGFKTLADLRSHIEKEGFFALRKRFQANFIAYLKDIFGHSFKGFGQEPGEQINRVDKLQQQLFAASDMRALENRIVSRNTKPAVVYEPLIPFIEIIECDYPLNSIELLYEPMKSLLQRLCDYLIRTQQQCLGVTWCLSDIYQNEECLKVRSERIYRDWQLLYELSLIQLERIGLPFEVDQLALCEPLLAPVHFEDRALDHKASETIATSKNIQRITARLQARVGENNVFKLSTNDEHIPELSQRKVAVHEQVDDTLFAENRYAERPAWLLNAPVPIGKQQNNLYWHGRIHIIRGPEKVSGHWWDKPIDRDYFVAVRDDHVRLWVFHDALKNEWCVQGVF